MQYLQMIQKLVQESLEIHQMFASAFIFAQFAFSLLCDFVIVSHLHDI